MKLMNAKALRKNVQDKRAQRNLEIDYHFC